MTGCGKAFQPNMDTNTKELFTILRQNNKKHNQLRIDSEGVNI